MNQEAVERILGELRIPIVRAISGEAAVGT